VLQLTAVKERREAVRKEELEINSRKVKDKRQKQFKREIKNYG